MQNGLERDDHGDPGNADRARRVAPPPPGPGSQEMMIMSECQLCGSREGRERPGRLGRYAVTCEACEDRRGSHLVGSPNGYRAATR